MIRKLFFALTIGVLLSTVCTGEKIDYGQVEALLTKYCAGCHNDSDSEGQFSVASFEKLMEGGEKGKVVTPGSAASSRLHGLIQRTIEPSMPPEGEPEMHADEKQLIADWLDAGAKGPADKSYRFQLNAPKIKTENTIRPITAIALDRDGAIFAKGSFRRVEICGENEDETRVVEVPGKVNSLHWVAKSKTLYVATGVTGLRGSVLEIDGRTGAIGRTFEGHSDICYKVDVSVDGSRLVSTSYDRTAIVWDLESGEPLAKLTGHNAAVFDAEFAPAPNEHNVATASADGTIKIWSPSGVRLDTRGEPLKEQTATAFDPGGQFFVGAGEDNRIRKWAFTSTTSPGTNELLVSRFAHKSAIQFLEFKPDGTQLVTVSKNGNVKFWDTEFLTELGSLGLDDSPASSLAVADSKLVIGLFNGTTKSINWPANAAVGEPGPSSSDIAGDTPMSSPIITVADPEAISEVEPNNEVVNAQSVQLPFVVTGKLFNDAPSDSDVFAFEAKQGDVWIFETRGQQLKSPIDTKIEILQADGSAVPRVKLRAIRDSYFTFRGKDSMQTGDFRLHNWEEMQLGELLYCNGEVVRLYHYPRGPDSGFNVFPNFGKRQTLFDTTPISHALNEPCFVVEAHPPSAELPATGLPEYIINYENDDDSLRQLGHDSRLTFTAPKTAKYLVRVSDSRRFSSAEFKYELVARRPKPSFDIVTIQNSKAKITKGTYKRIGITIRRNDGFNQPVKVHIENLPEGVTAPEATVIEPGQLRCWIPIYAHPDAELKSDAEVPTVVATSEWHETETKKSKPFQKLELVDDVKLKIKLHGDTIAKDGIPEVTIRPGETRTIRLSVERVNFKGRINFGKEDAAINSPFGVFVDHTGLNGVLLPPSKTERQFFLTAEPFVKPMKRLVFVEAEEAGRPASNPIRLIVLPNEETQTTSQD